MRGRSAAGSVPEYTGPRVLFFCDHLGYANGVTHGATTYFLGVLPRLRNAGVELTTCFLRERHEAAEALESEGVCPFFLNRSKWDLRAYSDLLELIRQRDVDLVHAAGMKGILLGRLAARAANVPAVIHLHDTAPPGRLLGALQRSLADSTTLCLTISRAVARCATRDFGIPPGRVRTLYNGIDLKGTLPVEASERARVRASVRRELDLPEESAVVGIVGRLVPEKGHKVVIRALESLQGVPPPFRLLVVGEGPERAACEGLVARNGLGEMVRFTGHRTDVPRLLLAMDVLAVPSHREGLSYSILEAMAAGVPVVASRVGGIPEIIRDRENGLLVRPGDPEALAVALRELSGSSSLRESLADRGRSTAEEFSVERHMEGLLAIYREVLQRGQAGGSGAPESA